MSILIGNCLRTRADEQHKTCGGFAVASFRIEFCMRVTRFLATILLTVLIMSTAYAGTPGSFRGTIVEGDQGAPKEGWLYVRGRNGSIRRVDISQAAVAYDEDVPADERKLSAREQLVVGAEVRVTAEQGNDGEWRASRVEIVKPAPSKSANGFGGGLICLDLGAAVHQFPVH